MADPFQPKFVDLVRNTTTTTGTGNIVLGAAVNGFTGFASAVLPGESFYYSVIGIDKPLGSIDRTKMNVKGGSVALGHPFGATGARVLSTMAKLLSEKGKGRGLISICTGGGMGVTAIVER